MMASESEARLHGFILDSLSAMGWNRRSPQFGGQVFTQHEVNRDDQLRAALQGGVPENVIVVNPGMYWVVEAKRGSDQMEQAIDEACDYADRINAAEGLSSQIVTGVVGSPDSIHEIQTYCRSEGTWRRLALNGRFATGFISPEQAISLLHCGGAELVEYEVDDELFNNMADSINQALHSGGINKRNRAGVLASILLALANDPNTRITSDLSTLISDINQRAKRELERYGKGRFFSEIEIHPPTSDDNHVRHRQALVSCIEKLRSLNITSAINSGRDILGTFYEQFLAYANDAKELGIVLTPRHITRFGAEIIDVSPTDIVFDPACGTGGFLVAALDRVRSQVDDVQQFQEGNLHGIDNDPMIATLAIVNMIFRGDGSSNIVEGDGLTSSIPVRPNKVLMNPPFALDEPQEEWRFVERSLDQMAQGGLIFAILPTTSVGSSNNGRGERAWRKRLLGRHTLKVTLRLPEDLFYPHVKKGTVGVVIEAHRPHRPDDLVFWAVLDDGIKRSKLGRQSEGPRNIGELQSAVGNFLRTGTQPINVPRKVSCKPAEGIDLYPMTYLDAGIQSLDVQEVQWSLEDAHLRLSRAKTPPPQQEPPNWPTFESWTLFQKRSAGKVGVKKTLQSAISHSLALHSSGMVFPH